jgi:hypothetical protein
MTDIRTTIFADGILDASVTHGVARLTLAQTGADGKPQPAGQLVVPLVQLPAFANGLMGLLRQVEQRMKEAQQAAGGNGRPAPGDAQGEAAPDTHTIPGAFRFGG